MAGDALVTTMDFYFEDNRPVPLPSKPKRVDVLIDLAPSITTKVLLLNAMLEQKVTPAKLARRSNTRRQDVNRLVALSHATKIDTIAAARGKLGLRLEVCLAPA